ncbi:hypothetical protein I4U23_031326 [Adineta vaga]|nr:hypothetical protein I4U23_031326 [Adineta vaga]
MINTIYKMVIFGLLLIFLQMKSLSTVPTVKNCEANVLNNVIKTRRSGCIAIGEHGTKYCSVGDQVMKKSVRSLCISRRKRSGENSDCTFSESLNKTLCITPEFIYQLGEASYEPCKKFNNGKQKCVGNMGFITCTKDEWIITDICEQGTTCQRQSTSNQHVYCL